jgi:hypothetical protein
MVWVSARAAPKVRVKGDQQVRAARSRGSSRPVALDGHLDRLQRGLGARREQVVDPVGLRGRRRAPVAPDVRVLERDRRDRPDHATAPSTSVRLTRRGARSAPSLEQVLVADLAHDARRDAHRDAAGRDVARHHRPRRDERLLPDLDARDISGAARRSGTRGAAGRRQGVLARGATCVESLVMVTPGPTNTSSSMHE